jgi:hypothetical protein
MKAGGGGVATLGQVEIEGQDVFKHQQIGPKKSPLEFKRLCGPLKAPVWLRDKQHVHL